MRCDNETASIYLIIEDKKKNIFIDPKLLYKISDEVLGFCLVNFFYLKLSKKTDVQTL